MKIRLLVPVQLRTTLVAVSPLCSGLSMTAAILSTVSVYRLCSQMTSHGGMSSFVGSCSSASMFLDFQTSFYSLMRQRLQEKDCSTVTTAICGPCRTRGQWGCVLPGSLLCKCLGWHCRRCVGWSRLSVSLSERQNLSPFSPGNSFSFTGGDFLSSKAIYVVPTWWLPSTFHISHRLWVPAQYFSLKMDWPWWTHSLATKITKSHLPFSCGIIWVR